jgi:hypothetical protein
MSNFYTDLRRFKDPVMAQRCAQRLLKMRTTLAPLRAKRRDGTLMLATWNIRDFGSGRLNPSPRLPETFFYLAEVAACFDLIAMQEVNRNLADFLKLVSILGPGWDYLLTDVTEGTSGNGERMAFLYRTDKVRFRKIAGEIVLPKGLTVVPAGTVKPPITADPTDPAPTEPEVGQQFARTPFLVAFQSGWFHFNLCTVHLYYGTETGPGLRRRIAEIRSLVQFFASRQDKENAGKANPQQGENYILLGDFNVVSPQHETMAALVDKGFTVPEQIDAEHLKTRNHFYDQIAVRVRDPRFATVDGGVVDLYADVFTDDDVALYADQVPATVDGKTPLDKFRTWRTWQMSDHNPLWVQVKTDFSDSYLEQIGG